MENFFEELSLISELYPDTFKILVISSYLIGFFCPLADGIALKCGFHVGDLLEKRSKRS